MEMAIEDRIQNTGDSLGKPGNQGNSMQGNRMTGNQDALQMVRGFAPYPHTRCFQTRIYADLHRVGVFILFLSRILYKLALFFQNKANLPAVQN